MSDEQWEVRITEDGELMLYKPVKEKINVTIEVGGIESDE